MPTTQSKLNKLIETKSNIRQKIISLGVDVPMSTPFKDYPSLIEQLAGAEFIETTTDQDLLQLLDLYRWLGTAEYENYVYTEEEIQMVHDLLNLINEGESEGSDTVRPYLFVSDFGKTEYYEEDLFDFTGYVITMLHPDGTKIDVTEKCTYNPSGPLTVGTSFVTISCDVDGVIFTVDQPIRVRVYVPSLVVTRDMLDQGTFYNVTPTYLTDQVDGSDGFTIVGRNSKAASSAVFSGNLRWEITLDLTGWNTLTFYARKNANHGLIRVGLNDDGIQTSFTSLHYDSAPTSWTKYTVNISSYSGVHTVYFLGGYTDSSGNTGSSTSYCNIIFSQ